MTSDIPVTWRAIDIRYLAVATSLLLSGIMLLTGWLPNEDAFTYIRTVEIYQAQGLAAAYSHYPWATYSILISLLDQLLPGDAFLAAVILNALFFSLLVYAFISLVSEIDGSRTTLILAAITVLVYPQLNENRLVIVRDSAFWSLALFGLWQYIIHLRTGRLRHGAGFLVGFLLAAAFRAEALVFVLLIPFSRLLDTRTELRQRGRQAGLLLAGTLVALLLLAGAGLLAGVDVPGLFVDQLAVYLPFVSETFFPGDARTAELGRAIFGDYAANFSGDYLPFFMTAGLLSILLAFLFKGIGGPFLLVAALGTAQRLWHTPRWLALPLLSVVLINGLIALGFLVTTRFLSSRYVLLMCLVLALFIPVLLARFYRRARNDGRGSRAGWLIGLLLAYCAIDAYVSFGTDKDYLQEAGEWIATNSDPQTPVLTNNRTVAYYSKRIDAYDQVPVLLNEADVLRLAPGSLVAFEEDTSLVGLFGSETLGAAVEELIRIGPESSRQVIIYRRR